MRTSLAGHPRLRLNAGPTRRHALTGPNLWWSPTWGGNAGLANASAAAALGVPSTVFVPLTAPAVKVAALGKVGAAVVQEGTEYVDAYQRAMDFVAASGALYCHAYDQPEIAAGAGTISLELEEQLDGVDTVLVAVGGGVKSVLVSDEQIAAARIFLWENYRIVLENGAAAAYAALQSGAYVPRSDERVAVILCGANTDPAGL